MPIARRFALAFALVALALGSAAASAAPDAPRFRASAVLEPTGLRWETSAPFANAQLRLALPDGSQRDYSLAGPIAAFDFAKAGLADGRYVWEIRFAPPASMQKDEARRSAADRRASGAFTIAGGAALVGMAASSATGRSDPGRAILKDQVVADDLIVQGSLCAGADCVNNESFGFDTIRLKGQNLRVHFQDTSVGTFPTNDWRLLINDTADGGAEYFGIEDSNTGRRVFAVLAGAPIDSVVLDSGGRLGIGTATPVLRLHLADGNTPTVRLDQDNTSGFTPWTWDIGGNEAGFFVKDVTGGNRLPLRIRPGAPTSSIDIAAGGDVGIGTPSPAARLHVWRNDGSARMRVEEASSTTSTRTLLELVNNGAPIATLTDTNAGTTWELGGGSAFTVATTGAGTPQFSLASNGNLAITGTLSTGSSRALKTAIEPVDATGLLAKVASLPLYAWSYTNTTARHLGPMAEDFHRTFGLGSDERTLAPADVAGVALGAAQELVRRIRSRDADIAAIRARLESLELRLTTPEGAR